MVLDIVKWTVISLILIILLHNLYLFFKKTLTIPKTKDLVNRPTEQYKKIYTSLNNKGKKNENMKNELKTYLKELSSKAEKKTPPTIESAGDIFAPSGNFTNY